MEKEIRAILDELFALIGISVKINVSEEEQESEKVYKVEIESDESTGLLIGSHGTTLLAIQSFVAIAIKQKTGEWIKISIDIAGWNKKQSERLADLAKQTADRAKQTGEPQKLYNLNATQRREIHMALKEESGIETVSEGEGQDRYLIVKPK